jgi:hypothetical protein
MKLTRVVSWFGVITAGWLLVLAQTALAVVSATGGNSTNDIGGYRIHTFTNDGTFDVSATGVVDVLVVGGGGGGGGFIGGGGGAGGLIYTTAFYVASGPITVTIGAGGGAGASVSYTGFGTNGANSVFSNLTALGGGRGGAAYVHNPGTNGSGGGAGSCIANGTAQTGQSGTPGQGSNGGISSTTQNTGAGGGGGAGTVGTNGTATKGGDGGAGISVSISGSDVIYGGGGGGANWGGGADGSGGAGGGGDAANPGRPGRTNSGGGGGGGGINPVAAGGVGGSGIVIVRYVLPLEAKASSATAIGSTKAILNGSLGGDGNDTNTTVAFCWGYSDGGTGSTSSWSNVILMGTNWSRGQIFSNTLTGLSSGSNHTYRCYATNSTGEDWSDLISFTPSAINATGGNSTNTLDGYTIHTFTTSGTFSVTSAGYVDVLVVAGGGGGGGYIGGGGGAGGLIYTQSFSVATGTNITVTVGAGGAGGANATTTGFGGAGSNSVFATVTASGGGRGGANYVNNNTGSGGSGGGAGSSMASGGPALGQSGTAGQGNNGGKSSYNQNYGGGGGGGAGTGGSDGTDAKGGNGGNGVSNSISGATVVYAGGGGGACYSGTAPTRGNGGLGGGGHAGNPGTNGLANTGGGGGGGGVNAATAVGGTGGSGIVIVRYIVENAPVKPVVRADAAVVLGATRATLNGTVLSVAGAGNPATSFCWGSADGGTNSTSAWANVTYIGANWGQNQSFATNIADLLAGSNYVYRCYVTNSSGDDFSDELVSFTTVTYPTVTNSGTVGPGDRLGAIQGAITATGGEIPRVWIEYWLDGGAVTSIVDCGLQSGGFTNTITGLNYNTAYQFRILASNDAGIVWSTISSFRTSSWKVIDDNTSGYFETNLIRYTGMSTYGAYNGTMGWSEVGTNKSATWTFTGLANGNYDVAYCHPNNISAQYWHGRVRYSITGANHNFGWFSSVNYGYRNDLSLVDTTGVSRAFRIINMAPVKVTDGTLQVQMIAYTNSDSMVADAVAITPTSNRTVFISDDKSGVFTTTFANWAAGAGSADGTYRQTVVAASASNEWAKWVFAGATSGRYKIWITWVGGGANRNTNAIFKVYSGDEAVLLGSNPVNQRNTPQADVMDWSVNFQQLTNGADSAGTYAIRGDTVFSVRIQAADNSSGLAYTSVDAVRVEMVESFIVQGTLFTIK